MDEHQEILGDSYIFLAVDISKETQYLKHHIERNDFFLRADKMQQKARKTINHQSWSNMIQINVQVKLLWFHFVETLAI